MRAIKRTLVAAVTTSLFAVCIPTSLSLAETTRLQPKPVSAAAAPLGTVCIDYQVTYSLDVPVVPGTTDTGNHCDDCITAVATPFPVTYYGGSYNSINVGSTGFILFGNTNFVNTGPTCYGEVATAFDRVITVYSHNFTTLGTGLGIFTSTSGTTPNRVFNVEWRVRNRDFLIGMNSFQARFYEGSSRIDLIYGPLDDEDGSTWWQSGPPPGNCFTIANNCDEVTPSLGRRYILTTVPPTFDSQFDFAGAWVPVTGTWTADGTMHNDAPSVPAQTRMDSMRYGIPLSGPVVVEARLSRTGGAGAQSTAAANGIVVNGTPGASPSLGRWSQGYYFQYTRNGTYSIYKYNGTSLTAIQPWTPSSAINTASGAYNILRAAIDGANASFAINGVVVYSTTSFDTAYTSGSVGATLARFSTAFVGERLDVDWAFAGPADNFKAGDFGGVSAKQQRLNDKALANPRGTPFRSPKHK